MPPPRPLPIYFDGGCRPNPGRIEAAVVVRGHVHFFDDLGEGSSSEAEWLALIAAVALARDLGEAVFDLLGDNRHVIEQASALLARRCRPSQPHQERFAALAADWPPRRLRWLPRQQNLAGIALEARHNR